MAPEILSSGLNYGLGINYGNQFNLNNGNFFGIIGSISYKNEQTFYEDTQDNIFNFSTDKSIFSFEENRIQSGTIGGA